MATSPGIHTQCYRISATGTNAAYSPIADGRRQCRGAPPQSAAPLASVAARLPDQRLCRALPAEPVDDRLPHDEILVAALEPRQFLGEHCHALPVRARHAGNVGAPETTLRPERVIDLADVFVDVAVGVGRARVAWRPRELDRDIGMFGECEHFTEIDKSSIVGPGTSSPAAAMVVDVELQSRMAFGDPPEFGHVPAG